MKKFNNKSFTLLELLVVIAVIAILTAVIIISLSNARTRAKRVATLSFESQFHRTMVDSASGLWNLNAGMGIEAKDSSGHENHGTLVNNPQWKCTIDNKENTPSGNGCSLEFNGTNNYIKKTTLENDSLDLSTDFTISVWVKRFDINRAEYVLSKNVDLGNEQQYSLYLYHQTIMVILSGGSLSWPYNDWENNKWYHILITRNGSSVDLWINKEKNPSTKTKTGTLSFMPNFSIGRRSNSADGSTSHLLYKGLIDEVRIYERALTAHEIKQLYAESLPRHLSSTK